jgi:hypothetical protein
MDRLGRSRALEDDEDARRQTTTNQVVVRRAGRTLFARRVTSRTLP